MSQLSRHPAYLMIEDQLDAVGQKYRVLCIFRGALLWAIGAVVSCVVAALAAHFIGQSHWTYLVLALWLGWLLVSLGTWFLRPLLIRPKSLEVARLVESRVKGLHNGLTNSVLLAAANDLHQSPWLPAIFEENLQRSRNKSLDEAVQFSDLKKLAFLALCCVLPIALALAVPGVRTAMRHGWNQMFSPMAFVPKVGSVEIVDVQPKSITLMNGQPLEITVAVRDPQNSAPSAHILFDNTRINRADIAPSSNGDDSLLHYSYRLEHVEESMKFRVEVGGSETQWFNVNVVKQVRLEQVNIAIDAPAYTNTSRVEFHLMADEIDKTPITAPEGSKVELSGQFDVPTSGALLQVGDGTPTPMEVHDAGHRFSGSFRITQDSAVSINLTENGQIISTQPNPPLFVRCIKDTPPSIEMKWPTSDTNIALNQEVKIQATIKDDHGLSAIRVLLGTGGAEQPLAVKFEKKDATGAQYDLNTVLAIPQELRKHNTSIRIQVEAVDNRDILLSSSGASAGKDLGPQTTSSGIIELKFRDSSEIRKQEQEQFDKLRAILQSMLERQTKLHTQTIAWHPGDKTTLPLVTVGQTDLRQDMQHTAETFAFEKNDKLVQKTLMYMAVNEAKDAVEFSQSLQVELVEKEQIRIDRELQARQRRIIAGLEKMLAMLNAAPDPTTQPTTKASEKLPADQKEKYTKLNEDLKKFMEEEKRILDQTAALAKKPVDNYDNEDKKKIEELAMAQEKMDAFMKEKVNEAGKLAEQDMANAALLKQMMEVYSEVTMAKDALKQKAAEIAVPLEEMGLELAKEITSNIEKWLANTPDRQQWTLEEPTAKTDVPAPELPKELEDMVGELMEQQEDLFDEMEDATSSWLDSADKGVGMDVADGPIADMSAKGVTANVQPNDNEMNGRSGEGRSGKSSGEMAEDHASGKGGRPTPTRLDATPFAKGQVKDESKDPTGGASGGGKLSGQGGQGLEGPVGPKQKQETLGRLADKQAQLRNKAEKLDLKAGVGRLDNFKLDESVSLMRRVEADLKANRYNNALRRRDVLLDSLDSSQMDLAGQINVQHDTTPQSNTKVQEGINDAMKGQLPAQWSEALKEYYKKLGNE